MKSLLGKIDDQLNEYYRARTELCDNSVKVGWKSNQAQAVRFAQLEKLLDCGPGEHIRINDLGCGLGEFSEFLAAGGRHNFSYCGYDVLPHMVEGARKLYGSNANRRFVRIEKAGDMQPADYTVASGILNLKFTIPEHEWLYYVLETINVMIAKSSRGVAFNLLTKYSDSEFMKDELYYADPCFLFDYCKRKLSRNVALLHDYNEYDFTIIVRKT